MSIMRLSRRCLKVIRKAYRADGRTAFDMPFFVDACPGFNEDVISMALYRLKSKGVVSILAADNIAYMTTYRPDADESYQCGWIASALKQLVDILKP